MVLNGNFIFYFIIIKANCSSYNKLDLQLALLILSAGDRNGNIVKNKNDEYLKININKEGNGIQKDTVNIIPSLAEIKRGVNIDEKTKIERINNKFRYLYKKAERLIAYRIGYEYDQHYNNKLNDIDEFSNLFSSFLYNEYNKDNSNMRDNFITHINNLDLYNAFGINLINNNNGELELISFCKNIGSFKDTLKIVMEILLLVQILKMI
ncbi:hypothetical protein BCR36DRAFT_148065 [Piromyces finnis]|uniref:Uncharacterized protein n=1 Tax=Piromyces finnis TaxID=1754191 RepID=A0A1Y1UXF9_9FUNG|nr:hypothetical protein BCR36DRAFT_148065 [Piromyces finnis]|eukprot:ORX42948.1 hypothetical protein BCR36DRAFT_148065 [Piromyces finnis]